LILWSTRRWKRAERKKNRRSTESKAEKTGAADGYRCACFLKKENPTRFRSAQVYNGFDDINDPTAFVLREAGKQGGDSADARASLLGVLNVLEQVGQSHIQGAGNLVKCVDGGAF
jgi:hypothetical protein